MLLTCESEPVVGACPSQVIVIEDDLDHQKIAELTLRAAGADKIIFFSTGEEAIDYFRTGIPPAEASSSVIFIDLMLPNIGGLEILKQLKSDNRWKSSRMIILTCSTDAQDRILSKQYGADAFLTKPLRTDFVKKLFST